MLRTTFALLNDENGFIVSAELVLVGTVCVLGVLVGLSELAHGVNQELEDVGSAIGSVNQSYHFSLAHGAKGCVTGSSFEDHADECDSQCDVTCEAGAQPESDQGH